MAVVSAAITSAILAAGQGIFPGSQNLPRIASAVGKSIPSWLPLPTNVLVQGVTTGVLGGGTVNGKLFVTGGAALVVAGLASAGMTGPAASGLGAAVGSGVASVLNSTAQYFGSSPGVGVGSDVSKVSLSNSATLIGILLGNLQGSGVNGPLASQLATGLGTGIAGIVQTGFGFGGVTGSPSPIPAASTSLSTVL
jgi:hypothetical protein